MSPGARYFKPGNIKISIGSVGLGFRFQGPPAWQGAKTQEYLDIPSFHNAARRDAPVSKM
jgi:hypothetical protein